jgi:hypothetical protein
LGSDWHRRAQQAGLGMRYFKADQGRQTAAPAVQRFHGGDGHEAKITARAATYQNGAADPPIAVDFEAAPPEQIGFSKSAASRFDTVTAAGASNWRAGGAAPPLQ